jgi:hypothetical protein
MEYSHATASFLGTWSVAAFYQVESISCRKIFFISPWFTTNHYWSKTTLSWDYGGPTTLNLSETSGKVALANDAATHQVQWTA